MGVADWGCEGGRGHHIAYMARFPLIFPVEPLMRVGMRVNFSGWLRIRLFCGVVRVPHRPWVLKILVASSRDTPRRAAQMRFLFFHHSIVRINAS